MTETADVETGTPSTFERNAAKAEMSDAGEGAAEAERLMVPETEAEEPLGYGGPGGGDGGGSIGLGGRGGGEGGVTAREQATVRVTGAQDDEGDRNWDHPPAATSAGLSAPVGPRARMAPSLEAAYKYDTSCVMPYDVPMQVE